MAGQFYSFDGVDGAGKSTQIELFCEHLKSIGKDVVRCRDPGTTPLGEKLRGILLHRHDTLVGPLAEMLIYMASRAELVEQVIAPALDRGQTVVSDRFLLSNVVYQGYGGGLDVEEVRQVGMFATGGRLPDITFVLDLPTPTARERREGNPDRIESRDEAFFERVRDGFLKEAAASPQRISVINGDGSVDDVHQRIIEAYRERRTEEN